MVGTNTGTIGIGVSPHIRQEIDLSELSNAIGKIEKRKEYERARSSASYGKFLSQEHKGRWATEMQQEHEQLLDEYAELYANDVSDPLSGHDPKSLEFQKRVVDFNTRRNQAFVLDEHLNKVGQEVSKAKPGEYEPSSVADAMSAIDLPFKDVLSANVAFPEKARQVGDLMKVMDIYAKGVYSRRTPNATDTEIAQEAGDFVDTAPPEVLESLSAYYSKLPQTRKQQLMERAAEMNIPDPMGSGVLKVAASELLKSRRTPYDFNKTITDMVATVDPPVHSNDLYSSYTSDSEIKTILERKGMTMVLDDPRILGDEGAMRVMGITSDDSDNERKAKARAYFRSLYVGVKNRNATKRAPRQEGGNEKKVDVQATVSGWWSALFSNNVQDRANAIRFLDRDELVQVAPNVPKDAKIMDIGVRPGGIITISTDSGEYTMDASASEEALKNVYSKTAKSSGRVYGSNETSMKVPSSTSAPATNLKGLLD